MSFPAPSLHATKTIKKDSAVRIAASPAELFVEHMNYLPIHLLWYRAYMAITSNGWGEHLTL